jgi:hypothetical protein
MCAHPRAVEEIDEAEEIVMATTTTTRATTTKKGATTQSTVSTVANDDFFGVDDAVLFDDVPIFDDPAGDDVAGGDDDIGGGTGSTGNSTVTTASTETTTSSPSNEAAKGAAASLPIIPIAAGAGGGIILLIIIIVLVMRRNRKQLATKRPVVAFENPMYDNVQTLKRSDSKKKPAGADYVAQLEQSLYDEPAMKPAESPRKDNPMYDSNDNLLNHEAGHVAMLPNAEDDVAAWDNTGLNTRFSSYEISSLQVTLMCPPTKRARTLRRSSRRACSSSRRTSKSPAALSHCTSLTCLAL